MDFLTKLMDCNVPAELELLLKQLAPTYDPQRKLMLFVPTLAGFNFKLDFGRIVPPSMMIHAHHLLASVRRNSDPEVILRTFYATNIIRVEDSEFTPSNFLGGYFDHNQRPTTHSNWLNTRFEEVFISVAGREDFMQRPTLAKLRLTPHVYEKIEAVDPYEFLLGYNQDNIENLLQMMTDVSNFVKTGMKSSKKIGQILDSVTGIDILCHSIWPATLPTCHNLDKPTVTAPQETQVLTDAEYTCLVSYLVSGPVCSSKLPPPTNDIEKAFYLVSEKSYDLPFEYEKFSKTSHIQPDVLWFQPYVKNPSALDYALTLGLLIETGDIDGTCIPLPNIRMSLTENNSMFLQGTLPLPKILSYVPSTHDDNQFRLCSRRIHSKEEQPTGIALRDSATVIVPRFAAEGVRANMGLIYGATVHENCNATEIDFTYSAWKSNEEPSLPSNSVYLWSSYRYVEKSNKSTKKIYLYYTMRQFYGGNVTLSRTLNPTLLLPA